MDMKWIYQTFSVLYLIISVLGLDDPYKILGVYKSATVPEIKRSYKQLTKEW